MLNFIPPGMAERYLLFTFVAVLGLLQLIAAHYRWAGLSLVGRQRWGWGYVLGAVLLGGAYVWFFGAVQHLVFQIGLAGAELFTLFAVSSVLAIGATLALVSLLHRSPGQAGPDGERVTFGPGHGTLRRPVGVDHAGAAIVVSDLPDGDFSISQLTDRLVDGGLLTLIIDLARDGLSDSTKMLDMLPAAAAYLQDRSDVDGEGVVLIGTGLGGDWVLRAAATAPSVRAVAVVDPVLNRPAVGLELLRHCTFVEAVRWGRLRHRLAEGWAAAGHFPQLGDRLALFVYREGSAMPSEIEPANVELAVADTDDEAVQQVVCWAGKQMVKPRHVL